MHTGLSQVSRILIKPLANGGAWMDTVCSDLQCAVRKHMEDLVWILEKCESGGGIIDLLICACFIQGIHDEWIKIKAKGSVNTPMAQLVEVALEEEVQYDQKDLEKDKLGIM